MFLDIEVTLYYVAVGITQDESGILKAWDFTPATTLAHENCDMILILRTLMVYTLR